MIASIPNSLTTLLADILMNDPNWQTFLYFLIREFNFVESTFRQALNGSRPGYDVKVGQLPAIFAGANELKIDLEEFFSAIESLRSPVDVADISFEEALCDCMVGQGKLGKMKVNLDRGDASIQEIRSVIKYANDLEVVCKILKKIAAESINKSVETEEVL
jgi:hypothetical protein